MRVHPLTGAVLDPPKKLAPATIRASYDAARSGSMDNYWSFTDRLDSDSANSIQVRSRLVQRSRYEVANNGYSEGILRTHSNYLIGCGPSLRMMTPDEALNDEIETAWAAWCKATKVRRKLWTMAHAKVQDGESFAICRSNPSIADLVKLDTVLIETEQCTTPNLLAWQPGKIDGIEYDEFGNPALYTILKYHPGSSYGFTFQPPERIPAKFVLHWYAAERPGQHRGIPEFKSTLNMGGMSRRWREATVIAAEVAASISALLETGFDPSDTDVTDITGMTAVQFAHGVMAAVPYGYKAHQMVAEHPNATYGEFNDSQLREQARPKCMPFNVASGDSSKYNYASGRLDHLSYNLALDVERDDCEDQVLDPLFLLWLEEASLRYGWGDVLAVHSWDWPRHPIIDVQSEAEANDVKLNDGATTLSQIYSEAGLDFEDAVEQAAKDYGVTTDVLRSAIFQKLFGGESAKQPNATAAGVGGDKAGGGSQSQAGY